MIKTIFKHFQALEMSSKVTIYYLMYNLFSSGLSFVMVAIFTRVQTIEEYGMYGVYQSWGSVFLILGSLYLDATVFSNGMIKFRNNRNEYLSSMISLSGLATIVLLVIAIINRNQISNLTNIEFPLILLCIINNYACIIQRLWGEKQKYELKYISYILINLMILLLSLSLSLVWMFYFEPLSIYRIKAYFIINVCFAGGLIFVILRKTIKIVDIEHWKYALKFNISLIPHYFAYTLMSQIDRIMIDDMCGRREVAIYSLAFSIGSIGAMVTNAVVVSLTPWTYETIRMGYKSNIIRKIYNYAKIVACAVILLSIFSVDLVTFLGTKDYFEAKSIIPIVLVSYYMFYLVSMFQLLLFYNEKKNKIVFSSCLSLVLNIGINYVGIKCVNYKMAAYATLFTYLLQAMISYVFFEKELNDLSIEHNRYKRGVIGITIVLLLTSVFIIFSIDNVFLRYFIGIVMCVVILMYGKCRETAVILTGKYHR